MAEAHIIERYVGAEGIQHVAQPEGSELSFAATVASVLGDVQIDEVNEVLRAASVSEDDGFTLPPWERKEVTVGGTVLVVDPILSPGEDASHAKEAVELIANRFEYEQPVALLFDSNADSTNMEEAQPQWVLLAGFAESFRVDTDPHWSQTNGVYVMNPTASEGEVIDPYEFAQWVEHSFETLGGVYAYALLEPQAFYDEQVRVELDRLDGQGWDAMVYQTDQELDTVTASLTLGSREQPWTYEEVEKVLTDAAEGDEDFLSRCQVTPSESDFDDVDIDYNGQGLEGLKKLVNALAVLGDRPIDEAQAA